MKKFNFKESIRLGNSPKRVDWLKNNYSKNISEEKFIEENKKLKEFSIGKKKNYCPSKLKGQYKHLKKTFGFFK